jgi:hypothetical protein
MIGAWDSKGTALKYVSIEVEEQWIALPEYDSATVVLW